MRIIAVIGFVNSPDDFFNYIEREYDYSWQIQTIGIPKHYFVCAEPGSDAEINCLFNIPDSVLEDFGVNLLRDIPVTKPEALCVYCGSPAFSSDQFDHSICAACSRTTEALVSDLDPEVEP